MKRVCRSTLQAEVLSAQDGVESAHYVRSLIYSFEVPRVLAGAEGFAWKVEALDSRTIHWITDCRSFVSYMSTNGQGTVSDKRLAIDLTSLRQDLWRVSGEMHGEPSTQEWNSLGVHRPVTLDQHQGYDFGCHDEGHGLGCHFGHRTDRPMAAY